MNAAGLLLVLLIALIFVDGALWLFYAKSWIGFLVSIGAIVGCVKLHRWAYDV